MQIQRLDALLRLETPAQAAETRQSNDGGDFGQMLQQAIERVEQDQQTAEVAVRQLVTGQAQDIAQVMIATERANLSLGLALQVRNRVLEAYQEIMRTPL